MHANDVYTWHVYIKSFGYSMLEDLVLARCKRKDS